MSGPATILLAEDETLVRQGLRLMIESAPDLRVAGEAGDGAAALALWERRAFDLIILDIHMPGVDGIQAARRMLARDPGQKILFLTTFNDEEYAMEALRIGASGYLLKTADTQQLIGAIRACLAGGLTLESQVAAKVMPRLLGRGGARGPASHGDRQGATAAGDGSERAGTAEDPPVPFENLTERELSVVRLVGAGRNNREIAEELGLTQGTVKNVVSTVLDKLGLRDRTQLAIHAIHNDLA